MGQEAATAMASYVTGEEEGGGQTRRGSFQRRTSMQRRTSGEVYLPPRQMQRKTSGGGSFQRKTSREMQRRTSGGGSFQRKVSGQMQRGGSLGSFQRKVSGQMQRGGSFQRKVSGQMQRRGSFQRKTSGQLQRNTRRRGRHRWNDTFQRNVGRTKRETKLFKKKKRETKRAEKKKTNIELDDPRFKPYLKMMKMHIPQRAIKQKMELCHDFTDSEIQTFLLVADTLPDSVLATLTKPKAPKKQMKMTGVVKMKTKLRAKRTSAAKRT